MYITAAEFKAKCLKIMDQVNDFHEEVIITKHGKPVAKLISVNSEPKKSIFGYLKNSVKVEKDIIEHINIEWDAENND